MPFLPQSAPPPSGAVLEKLHTINSRCGYLPEEELRDAARELGLPLSEVYGAAAFYSDFSFKPRGRHTIQVCMGTACYIRGGDKILDKIKAILGIKEDETTEDGMFTVKTVHCLGSCGLSPAIRVDADTYGRLRPDRIARILKKYVPEGSKDWKARGEET